MTRGLRNNNPFNIKYSPKNLWKGKIPDDKKLDRIFEEFNSLHMGIRAGVLLIAGYINRGYDTVWQIISRFAPPSENDTRSYLKNLHNFNSDIVLNGDTKISVMSVYFIELCRRIMYVESNYLVTFESLRTLIYNLNLFPHL